MNEVKQITLGDLLYLIDPDASRKAPIRIMDSDEENEQSVLNSSSPILWTEDVCRMIVDGIDADGGMICVWLEK